MIILAVFIWRNISQLYIIYGNFVHSLTAICNHMDPKLGSPLWWKKKYHLENDAFPLSKVTFLHSCDR